MARTSNITFGQVAQIADAMKAAGNRPTARAVRERIAQLNAAADRGDDLAARLANAEKRNAAQEVELKTASTTAQRATAELWAIAREHAAVKKNGAAPKVVKSTAKKTTVKKPANQELAV